MTSRRKLLIGAGTLAVAGVGVGGVSLAEMGSLRDYDAAMAKLRARLPPNPEFGELIRFATLAASGHNSQPWSFRNDGRSIEILPDLARRTPVVDPDDHHLFVSLGCAAENLALAASAAGQAAELRFDPSRGGSLRCLLGDGPPQPSSLFDAIPKRQSCRSDYDGKPVSSTDLALLGAAAAIPGVDLVLLTERQQIDRVRDLVIAGNHRQMGDPAFQRELKSWLRFNPRQALASGDGLFSAASGDPSLPCWLGTMLVGLVLTSDAGDDKYASQIDSSPGIALFLGEKSDHDHWVRCGRACQRFALQATALGLKHAFINQPVEVAELRPQLAQLAGLPGRRPDLVMRFGYGPDLPFSARRPVGSVIAQSAA
jgi:nitroreductase